MIHLLFPSSSSYRDNATMDESQLLKYWKFWGPLFMKSFESRLGRVYRGRNQRESDPISCTDRILGTTSLQSGVWNVCAGHDKCVLPKVVKSSFRSTLQKYLIFIKKRIQENIATFWPVVRLSILNLIIQLNHYFSSLWNWMLVINILVLVKFS